MTTVPAQSFSAPARAWVMAAARFMPGVWGVLMSSSLEWTTRTPLYFHWDSLIGLSTLTRNARASVKRCTGGNTNEKADIAGGHRCLVCRLRVVPGGRANYPGDALSGGRHHRARGASGARPGARHAHWPAGEFRSAHAA